MHDKIMRSNVNLSWMKVDDVPSSDFPKPQESITLRFHIEISVNDSPFRVLLI
jgi:hypothetical protein